MDKIASLESLVQNSLRPDLTVILDIDPELGLQRATRRGKLDRFETEQLSFFERVRATYLGLAATDSRRYQVIDAGASLPQVQKQIAAVLERLR